MAPGIFSFTAAIAAAGFAPTLTAVAATSAAAWVRPTALPLPPTLQQAHKDAAGYTGRSKPVSLLASSVMGS